MAPENEEHRRVVWAIPVLGALVTLVRGPQAVVLLVGLPLLLCSPSSFAISTKERGWVVLSLHRLLLDRPVVPIGILEEEVGVVRAAWPAVPHALLDVLDLADLHATAGEFGAGGLSIGHAQLQAGHKLVPMVTEQAEPCGVGWTLRTLSPIRFSTSTLNPSLSL